MRNSLLAQEKLIAAALILTLAVPCEGLNLRAADPEIKRPIPGQLEPSALKEFGGLGPERKKLVELALSMGRKHRLNQYVFGSADPERGGFDCSGSMYFILQTAGLAPTRSSASQYSWIERAGLLRKVPISSSSLEDPVFEKLRPGDLLFWSGTYKPTDGRTNKITHVQMYLGTEKETGKRVMIGSSDGRSYRGKARCGFGVYEFRLPRATSKARLVGFGPPPGLLKVKGSQNPSPSK